MPNWLVRKGLRYPCSTIGQTTNLSPVLRSCLAVEESGVTSAPMEVRQKKLREKYGEASSCNRAKDGRTLRRPAACESASFRGRAIERVALRCDGVRRNNTIAECRCKRRYLARLSFSHDSGNAKGFCARCLPVAALTRPWISRYRAGTKFWSVGIFRCLRGSSQQCIHWFAAFRTSASHMCMDRQVTSPVQKLIRIHCNQPCRAPVSGRGSLPTRRNPPKMPKWTCPSLGRVRCRATFAGSSVILATRRLHKGRSESEPAMDDLCRRTLRSRRGPFSHEEDLRLW